MNAAKNADDYHALNDQMNSAIPKTQALLVLISESLWSGSEWNDQQKDGIALLCGECSDELQKAADMVNGKEAAK